MNEELKKQIRVIDQRIKELYALYHSAANYIGISDGEFTIWSVLLSTEQDYSQQELCDLLSLPRQTMNSIISKLVRKGFVYLEHIPGTRNQKPTHLTPQGVEFGRNEVMWVLKAEERALEQADPQQIQVSIDLIETFAQHFKQELAHPQKSDTEM